MCMQFVYNFKLLYLYIMKQQDMLKSKSSSACFFLFPCVYIHKLEEVLLRHVACV